MSKPENLLHTRPTKFRDVLKPWRRFRSAVTGEYVTRAYAIEHPRETVSERVWEGERTYKKRR